MHISTELKFKQYPVIILKQAENVLFDLFEYVLLVSWTSNVLGSKVVTPLD